MVSTRECQPGRIPAPARKQSHGDDDQGKREANPHAVNAPAQYETESKAERESQYPITDQVRKHGHARFSQATQGAGTHGLDAVEYLERGCDPKQAGPDGE